MQVFVGSRLNVPGAWQMPQVLTHFLKLQIEIHESYTMLKLEKEALGRSKTLPDNQKHF